MTAAETVPLRCTRPGPSTRACRSRRRRHRQGHSAPGGDRAWQPPEDVPVPGLACRKKSIWHQHNRCGTRPLAHRRRVLPHGIFRVHDFPDDDVCDLWVRWVERRLDLLRGRRRESDAELSVRDGHECFRGSMGNARRLPLLRARLPVHERVVPPSAHALHEPDLQLLVRLLLLRAAPNGVAVEAIRVHRAREGLL